MGTPGKTGTLKVYFNADDLEGAKRKIDNAVQVRDYLAQKLQGATP